MIDIHSHILPMLDDGAATVEKAIQMYHIAQQDGIETIIATPHFAAGYFENDFDNVREAVDRLNQQLVAITMNETNQESQGTNLQSKKAVPNLLPGQEIFLDRHLLLYLKQGRIKGLNDSRYMLLELPMEDCPEYAMDMLYELRVMGIVPIIAHPERYDFIISNPKKANDLLQEGCLFQINAGSLSGQFGRAIKRTAIKLTREGMVSFIASDAHGTHLRRPELQVAYSKLEQIDRELPARIKSNAAKLINNQEILIEYETYRPKRSIFEIFRWSKVKGE